MLLADAVSKHPEHYGEIELPDFDPDERKELDDLYGPWGSKSWTGLALHTRLGRVEHHWEDEAGRGTLHFFHDFAHRENNQTLHVSSAGLNANVEMTDGSLGRSGFSRTRPDSSSITSRSRLMTKPDAI